MNLLLDTNVFPEVLLGQEQSESSLTLLRNESAHNLFMTDFSLHSIGVLLFRRSRLDIYSTFVKDISSLGIKVLALAPYDTTALTETAVQYSLDYDDAYQYEVAKSFQLTLISFDSDFNKIDIPHWTPIQMLTQ